MAVDLATGMDMKRMSSVQVSNSATAVDFGLGPLHLHLGPNGVNGVLLQSATEVQGMQATS